MKKIVRKLLKAEVISGETVVMDATFIKAYSKRDPHENSEEAQTLRLESAETARPTNSATKCTSRQTPSLSCP